MKNRLGFLYAEIFIYNSKIICFSRERKASQLQDLHWSFLKVCGSHIPSLYFRKSTFLNVILNLINPPMLHLYLPTTLSIVSSADVSLVRFLLVIYITLIKPFVHLGKRFSMQKNISIIFQFLSSKNLRKTSWE